MVRAPQVQTGTLGRWNSGDNFTSVTSKDRSNYFDGPMVECLLARVSVIIRVQ